MKKTLNLLTVAILILTSSYKPAPKYQYKFQDPSLPIEQRVNDLVSRLTLEEKVKQMLNSAPAIARLGIPAYNWWNESLHGVARTPFNVTVYPQAIAMAATFDPTSLHTMAEYTAEEGRAIYNESQRTGHTGIYLGLTYWTPNINIFRDPRWGRGQETYGEDPYLTATMGKAFVTGLQGNDPKYLKAAACAKHYAVHSGPEPSRHEFNIDVSNYDLWDTYLPAFHALVSDAKVAGVMCAYNAFRGQPCCGSDILLTDILRNQWHFKGYVTSDCGAIDDFYEHHKTHTNAETASVDAVLHGTDVECGNTSYLSLLKAVQDKMITEQQIDVSLKRLFTIRFRLGMFDPPAMVKYSNITTSALESPEHKAQSLKMARQSIVLLKNEHQTLPLSKSIKKIAVLGPNADNPLSVLGNYNGTPSKIVTPLEGIKEKLGKDAVVYYDQAVNYTSKSYVKNIDLGKTGKIDGEHGIKAEYFNNTDLSGKPVAVRTEHNIDNLWRDGTFVIGALSQKTFSARWTTDYTAPESENITFDVAGTGGYRLLIDGKECVSTWQQSAPALHKYVLNAEKGHNYHIVLESFQTGGREFMRLKTGVEETADFEAMAQKVKDADAIVFVGGISPQLEGEEMKVDQPGFAGGDRTSILLPEVQTELLKSLEKTGKPVIFVMMTGSAIATPWEAEHVPAIVNAWYGGQAAGSALADVLFGDYNPAGRLPVTFYKGDQDLTAFEDYSMKNRTYRYFKGQPLYGFGYGLSYTTFKYDNLKVPVRATLHKTVPVSVRVTNTGKLAGEEVVELYLTHQSTNKELPVRALKGFTRIYLKSGESRDVRFNLNAQDLSITTDAGTYKEMPGKILISVGGSQPDAETAKTKKTTSGYLTLAVK